VIDLRVFALLWHSNHEAAVAVLMTMVHDANNTAELDPWPVVEIVSRSSIEVAAVAARSLVKQRIKPTTNEGRAAMKRIINSIRAAIA